MEERHLQLVLAAAGYYAGGIDGQVGPESMDAIRAIEANNTEGYAFDPTTTTEKRRYVAALQAGLTELEYDPGVIDGWYGVFTEEALNAFLYEMGHDKPEVIDRTPLQNAPASSDIPHQNDVAAVYGRPGPDIESKLVTIELPFSLKIDWNLRKSTRRIRVHRLAAKQLETALIAVRDHYGAQVMADLGIDRYAGAYNHRRMRGGSKWSMHAYGCAIDFYAQPNGLRTRCPQALFCGDEYQPFLDIMEANEWLPALRLWGADAMHFQRAHL
ncbi:peptidoglycan-binding protein [uncultured Roseovarius sp.]|uniref:peptidoglycan-binding protein n=1 Tax=uncultured Roseovarius sp. TaxID=293344 RepID=UPI00262A80AA|nr:peptidoglycan-binding protein [uncultured Roseovarius sp.]